MKGKKKGTFAAQHPGRQGDPRIIAAVGAQAVDDEYPCVAAERLAASMGVTPGEIGVVLDLMEIRISRCQLGLFGYRPRSRIVTAMEAVPPDLEEAVRNSLERGRLPCTAAWTIAAAHGLPRITVAAACEALGIKISCCQLGAF